MLADPEPQCAKASRRPARSVSATPSLFPAHQHQDQDDDQDQAEAAGRVVALGHHVGGSRAVGRSPILFDQLEAAEVAFAPAGLQFDHRLQYFGREGLACMVK